MHKYDTWCDALAVANGFAAMTGFRHEVWRGPHTGKWRVQRTEVALASAVAVEPCS